MRCICCYLSSKNFSVLAKRKNAFSFFHQNTHITLFTQCTWLISLSSLPQACGGIRTVAPIDIKPKHTVE